MSTVDPPTVEHAFVPPDGQPWGLCQQPGEYVDADGMMRDRCNLAQAAHPPWTPAYEPTGKRPG